MDFVLRSLSLWFALIAPTMLPGQLSSTPVAGPDPISDAAELFALANETRATEGVGPVQWDASLADAAMKHCLLMTSEAPVAHQYEGEPDLTTRAAAAGAHFSVVEENLGVGARLAAIHQGWLDSPGHRKNLLNPLVDRVGIAVIVYQGLRYTVADYARAVPVLTEAQVEDAFANLLRTRNLMISRGSRGARAYCASSGNYEGVDSPKYVMRWQNPDVTELPAELVQVLAKGSYQKAAVGSCPAQDVNGAFTIYRVAVLLY